MFSRFNYVVIWYVSVLHSFLLPDNTLLDGYTTFCLFSHLLMDTKGCFLLWTLVYTFLCGHMFSSPLGVYLAVELLSHVVTLCLTFRATAKLFSKAAASFHIPTTYEWVFQCFHILISACYCLFLFPFSLPSGCEVVSHCGFDLHFLKD